MKRSLASLGDTDEEESIKYRKLDNNETPLTITINDDSLDEDSFGEKREKVLKQEEEQAEEDEEEEVQLSESQQRALDKVVEGKNIFITGNAGSGKTFLIERIKQKLTEMGRVFYVTASSGSAAFNVSGMTVHSFAGIGIGDKPVAQHLRDMKAKYRDRIERWKDTEVLIIDEISMLQGEYLEKIDLVARTLRNRKSVPFGGIQMVFVGDMTQLPPVQSKKDPKQGILIEHETRYAFHTTTWSELRLDMIKLETNFRQQTDKEFTSFLNAVRVGQMNEKEEALLKSRDVYLNRNLKAPEDATKLFAFKNAVLQTNTRELSKINRPSVFFDAEIYLCPFLQRQSTYAKNTSPDAEEKKYPVDSRIELKVGANVLLCTNYGPHSKLYNGSRGVIVKFVDITPESIIKDAKKKGMPPPPSQLLPLVLFSNGEEKVIKPKTWSQYDGKTLLTSFTQIPLIPSYALTIHKSQGLTLDVALVDTTVFAPGQLYVALSRVRRKEDLYVTNSHNKKHVLADKNVIAYYEKHNLL